jgi:hypothetical protein
MVTMTISVDLLTAQAMAREPAQDGSGWAEVFSAGVARALEVLVDGGHLIPASLVREDLEALSEDEVIAVAARHKELRAKAGAPDGMVAALVLRRALRRLQPAAAKLIRSTELGYFHPADEANGFLHDANPEVRRIIDAYSSDLTDDELDWDPWDASVVYLDLT